MIDTKPVNGNRLNGTVSQMPPPDLDQLRTDAAVAAGRLLSGLHGEQARLRAQLERIEREIGLTERAAMGELAALAIDPPNGQDRNGWGYPAAADPVIAVIDPAPLRELADGVADCTETPEQVLAELGYGGWQAAGDGPVGQPGPQLVTVLPMDLRDTPIETVIAGLSPPIEERIKTDLLYYDLTTLGSLAEWLTAEPERNLDTLLSVGKDRDYFAGAIRRWCALNGYSVRENQLTDDGLPREWFGEAEPEPEKPAKKARAAKKPKPAGRTFEEKLLESLNSHDAYWLKLKKNGATDQQITDELRKCYRDDGSLGDDWSARGGTNPIFYETASGLKAKKGGGTSGLELATAVRMLIEIPPGL